VGFVVGNVALGQVFSEYFGFPCQFSFHRLLHFRHHLSFGAGTLGQTMADVPSRLSLTPPEEEEEEEEEEGEGGGGEEAYQERRWNVKTYIPKRLSTCWYALFNVDMIELLARVEVG
jgi:hypothetical protein